jgi:TRAP transporter 4TM/12TM fusion protein
MLETIRKPLVAALSVVLCLFTLLEVNYHTLQPQSDLAIFVGLGLVLCFLVYPAHPRWERHRVARGIDAALAIVVVLCTAYIVVQTEPACERWWPNFSDDPQQPVRISINNRPGLETPLDFAVGVVGLLLVLEGTRRAIGWTVPLLSLLFMLHSLYCYLSYRHGLPPLPGWMLPHAGQSPQYLVSTTFIQSLGVYGPAASVMFTYVFLFVLFGSFLEMSGATRFIIDFAQRVFGRSPGGPAKVAVLGSGLMGSLSGSAVANAVTTGAFTIPMMRNAGFQPHVAGGITAAAASGGALVPPVMGAGAYMMLELVQPQVDFLTIVKAALIPAVLYYLSIFMIVHFYARRVGSVRTLAAEERKAISAFEGLVFFGSLATLILLLVLGFTPFKAVTAALAVILVLAAVRSQQSVPDAARVLAGAVFVAGFVLYRLAAGTPPGEEVSFRRLVEQYIDASLGGMFAMLVFGLLHPAWRGVYLEALVKSARNGVSLIAASACVGIIIGVVQATGIATDFSAAIKSVVEENLFVALVGIMFCSLVLGMGVPSVVCYLLMATMMGALLDQLGVLPLAAHLFIFYFGMMSMVTPPVALAAYASASIAGAPIMPTALAAFRFSLVGFTLPFMFVYRPELLLLSDKPQVVEVTQTAAAADGTSATQAVEVRARLLHVTRYVPNAHVQIVPLERQQPAEGAASQLPRTDRDGRFRIVLPPGEYRVSFARGADDARPGAGAAAAAATEELEFQHLGRLRVGTDLDPKQWFDDERLTVADVALHTGIATLGVIVLAAGIAGFLAYPLSMPLRLMLLAAAGLLLSPYLKIGGTDYGTLANYLAAATFVAVWIFNLLTGRRTAARAAADAQH